jgi:hypothetical protein
MENMCFLEPGNWRHTNSRAKASNRRSSKYCDWNVKHVLLLNFRAKNRDGKSFETATMHPMEINLMRKQSSSICSQQLIGNEAVGTHIGVELPDEAGEVVVLEVLGQQLLGEFRRVPHDEAGAAGAPRHHAVGRRVLQHLVGLDQERRRRARPAAARLGTLHFAGRRLSVSPKQRERSVSTNPTNEGGATVQGVNSVSSSQRRSPGRSHHHSHNGLDRDRFTQSTAAGFRTRSPKDSAPFWSTSSTCSARTNGITHTN